jgi:hypothetical protein
VRPTPQVSFCHGELVYLLPLDRMYHTWVSLFNTSTYFARAEVALPRKSQRATVTNTFSIRTFFLSPLSRNIVSCEYLVYYVGQIYMYF